MNNRKKLEADYFEETDCDETEPGRQIRRMVAGLPSRLGAGSRLGAW
jgi:hypothetical protein